MFVFYYLLSLLLFVVYWYVCGFFWEVGFDWMFVFCLVEFVFLDVIIFIFLLWCMVKLVSSVRLNLLGLFI